MRSSKRILGTILCMTMMGCNAQDQKSPELAAMLMEAKKNLVFVEGGTFMMGHASVPGADVVHEVTLDHYSINKYETTFKEFDIYTNVNGLDNIQPNRRKLKDYKPNYGVKAITWYQAKAYCQWLGKQLNLSMDLPTEAQWEYAARSRGLDVAHATNTGKIEGGDKDNYGDGPIGSYPPNPLGLYDMSGGRPEWTLDWAAGYGDKPVKNPIQDTIRIFEEKRVRGIHTLSYSVYKRGYDEPSQNGAGVGFRCVCNQTTPVK